MMWWLIAYFLFFVLGLVVVIGVGSWEARKEEKAAKLHASQVQPTYTGAIAPFSSTNTSASNAQYQQWYANAIANHNKIYQEFVEAPHKMQEVDGDYLFEFNTHKISQVELTQLIARNPECVTAVIGDTNRLLVTDLAVAMQIKLKYEVINEE